MNHPFIQMLRFEFKLNRKMWIIMTTISIVLLAILNFLISQVFQPVIFSFLYLISLLFTLLSYQETTNQQSLNLYHLIPVNQNIKFLSKIFITLFAFPVLVLALSYLFTFFGKMANYGDISHSQTSLIWETLSSSKIINLMCVGWLFCQSGSTLVAIVFKKYKLLYAMLIYFGIQLFLSPIILIASFKPIVTNTTRSAQVVQQSSSAQVMQQPSNSVIWIISLLVVVSIVLFGISYRLFIRRKL